MRSARVSRRIAAAGATVAREHSGFLHATITQKPLLMKQLETSMLCYKKLSGPLFSGNYTESFPSLFIFPFQGNTSTRDSASIKPIRFLHLLSWE
ncbi:uncharacterized protein K460DRAFT_364674 [Cucurbitaria berberidis CBS 394.84]|uniref:Uncharacterized protein n=1 Tax=Cucurbitaria berberidis CBS 394.84 TaxID=1168544 RepID=A0A9P4LBL3_9PLEO|nr:uncharacterized protein K460DRAFT_364674 [Cucurbitaria berberidis CBS 394.84]KAF1848678.1 hypothetical protein K460DRAFT_364674 [Cucurbitaria berberidis CBS 394.84]